MNSKTIVPVLLMTFFSICHCQFSHADIVIIFSADNGNTFSDSFEVTTGDVLSLAIYASETDPDNVLSTEGLVSFGLDLTTSPSDLGTISSALANPLFDFEQHNETTQNGFEWEYAETANNGIRNESILLGSFQFEARNEGTTVFDVEDRAPGSGIENASWLTPSLDILDEQVFGDQATGSFRFTVNAVSVPEPSSLVLLTLIAVTGAARRRRNVSK